MMFTTGSIYILCFLHLKYQFEQVYLEIYDCLKRKAYPKIMSLFKAHMTIEKETKLVNNEMKYYIYIMYVIIKPCFSLFVYLSHSPDSTAIMRHMTSFIVLLIVQLLFTINYLCALVTRSAHKPQFPLYNTILSRDQNIPLRIRFKIMRFIERLSGPEIGFYCYDLFPMTSYYFTDYVLDSIGSYFLVLRTLQTNGFL